ncbi:iron-containing alcohol dehydrogenase [Magnetospirillum sulfuroxidans]|uniref:Iron-containing alcohol dehydrogenase n=1 Tax=Magnetospirillum sulfuroxidans TaxID=611300 RepID=A0ABS5IFU5_9PROT|nr:iron-containing alcohol dehydrogenase [Magnetospirillum sulfuroxidans]MBR9973304.1 iron-containing alcohol dehydrogenase [Magnetospirillum sulfuroxidans]
MTNFVFETTPRIICETGAAAKLGTLAAELGLRKVLLVTDKGLVQAGILAPVLDGFAAAKVAVEVFSDVQADPPEASVDAAVASARTAGIDGVVGLGGGSSLDTAKLVALLAGNPQALPDIYGIGLAKGPRLPLIQVPTTAGTGSEVTPIAIVTTPTHEKKGVVSPLLYPDIAVLDGALTTGLPAAVTAMTGIDAMVHAIEAFTTRHKKNPLSDGLAIKALELLFFNIRKVIADGGDLDARNAMLQGSMLAGMAFANAPVAAVHALAYPLGGHFHVPHGHSNALVLVPVLRFNAEVARRSYAKLAAIILPGQVFASATEASNAFIDAMDTLVAEMPFAQRLRDVGVSETDLPMMAKDVMAIQRLLINNPRDVTEADALALYRSVY